MVVLLAFLERNVRSFQKVSFKHYLMPFHPAVYQESTGIVHAGNEVFKVLCCLNNNNKDIIMCDASV